jgi:hypothetical protein
MRPFLDRAVIFDSRAFERGFFMPRATPAILNACDIPLAGRSN